MVGGALVVAGRVGFLGPALGRFFRAEDERREPNREWW